MLFLTIPLVCALVAMIGIVVIVWRKMTFLRKLTPDAHEMGDTWLHDMAPEAIDWARNIQWRQALQSILMEFEKLLRRGRSVMSALDRASGALAHKVRRVHQESAKQTQEINDRREAARNDVDSDLEDFTGDDPEQLKTQEQALIVAIAQNPKDVDLYNNLARVYMRLGNWADAVEALQAALKLDPDNDHFKNRLEAAKKRLASRQATV